jgi:hypothetical protein
MIILTMGVLMHTHSYSQQWLDLNHAFSCPTWNNSQVSDLLITDSLIYARGYISTTYYCDEIWDMAIWNEQEWSPMPCEQSLGGGGGLANYNGKIFTTGNYTCSEDNVISTLLAWDGSSWEYHIIDSSSSWSAYDMIVKDDELYVAGTFGPIDNEEYGLVFKYDGDDITPLIQGCQFDDCEYTNFGLALAFYDDTLYVGGKFHSSQTGQRFDNLATINNSALHKVGIGLEFGLSIVEALCVHRDTLFIGGLFLQDNILGNEQMTTLLYYANGDLGVYGVHGTNRITAMQSYNDELYIAGWFQQLNGIECQGLAKLDGHELTVLNTQPFSTNNDGMMGQSNIRDLDIYNDTLYISGGFQNIGYDTTYHYGGVAKMNAALSALDVSEFKIIPYNISVFPNPANDFIAIQGIPPSVNYQVRVTDMAGRTIKTESNKSKIDIRELTSGMYLVSIEFDKGRVVKRFLKE